MEQVIKTQNPISTGGVPGGVPAANPVNPVLKKMPGKTMKNLYIVVAVIVVMLLGIGSGFLLSGNKPGSNKGSNSVAAPGAKQSDKEAGVADESQFPDSAEGVLEEGGIDGEGTHHLVRSADASKNVYLGSTVLDLQSFVGKKVKVWGQTISGKKAGWLMDVGKIQVVE